MKVSWIKYAKDDKNFKIQERVGLDVYKLENPEQIDCKIRELVKHDCKMIVISNELAGFSEDIITKYNNDQNINIIIARPRE